MATQPDTATPAPSGGKWWQTTYQNACVAAAGAMATALVTVGVPQVVNAGKDEASAADTREVQLQQSLWLSNGRCLGDPAPLWHDSREDRQIDATVCPGTGDILVQMRDRNGKLVQRWADLTGLHKQFEAPAEQTSALGGWLVGRAHATPVAAPPLPRPGGARFMLAQSVVCQHLFPNGVLRRRISTGPNQCVEITIDTRTGQVVSQRPVPCVPNCQVNA